MTRMLVLAAALLASPAALACGGADCGGCAKAHTETANVDDVDKAQGTKLTFAVTGMKCGKCSAKVTEALKGVDGVTAASVDHEAGVAKVAFDPKKTNEAALLKAIEGTGFSAQKSNS